MPATEGPLPAHQKHGVDLHVAITATYSVTYEECHVCETGNAKNCRWGRLAAKAPSARMYLHCSSSATQFPYDFTANFTRHSQAWDGKLSRKSSACQSINQALLEQVPFLLSKTMSKEMDCGRPAEQPINAVLFRSSWPEKLEDSSS